MSDFKILNYDELDAELQTYKVVLLEPSAYSTKRISEKMVRIQAYKDRVQSIIEDASKNRNILEQKYNELSSQIERKREGLLINNTDISKLPQKKAEAASNLKLEKNSLI